MFNIKIVKYCALLCIITSYGFGDKKFLDDYNYNDFLEKDGSLDGDKAFKKLFNSYNEIIEQYKKYYIYQSTIDLTCRCVFYYKFENLLIEYSQLFHSILQEITKLNYSIQSYEKGISNYNTKLEITNKDCKYETESNDLISLCEDKGDYKSKTENENKIALYKEEKLKLKLSVNWLLSCCKYYTFILNKILEINGKSDYKSKDIFIFEELCEKLNKCDHIYNNVQYAKYIINTTEKVQVIANWYNEYFKRLNETYSDNLKKITNMKGIYDKVGIKSVVTTINRFLGDYSE